MGGGVTQRKERKWNKGAFGYGNKTAVLILWGVMPNGMVCQPTLLDTRYDKTIKRNETDFKKWVQKYFEENYSKHILTIY